jgi:hypothetical protein
MTLRHRGKEWMTVVGYVYIMMQRAQIGRAAAASIVLCCSSWQLH